MAWRAVVTILGLLAGWQLLVWASGVPPYILPGPSRVLTAWLHHGTSIAANAWITVVEIVAGLVIGTLLGAASALMMCYFRPARRWLMPLLVISQAIPVFAIAPLLVLWLGYGLVSKIAMATLIIFFPVTASLFDGLRRTEAGWLDLAHTMTAGHARARWAILRRVRLPAALPAFASGLRVATAVAPIGAVVGEWVGSSSGLGYLMLHANGRMQTDVMFAALLTLAVLAVALYVLVDAALRRAISWQSDTLPEDETSQ